MVAQVTSHPFETPGPALGEWLDALGFSSAPTFRYVASDTMKNFVLYDQWQFAFKAAHGVILPEAPTQLPGYRIPTYRFDGRVQDEAVRGASVDTTVRAVASYVRTGHLIIIEQRADVDPKLRGVIPIHDILVEGTTYARDIIAQL